MATVRVVESGEVLGYLMRDPMAVYWLRFRYDAAAKSE